MTLFVVSCAACGHTEAFPETNRGATGPLAPGDEARLTYGGATSAEWTPDGRGIVIAEVDSAVRPAASCIMILPAAGGSAIWEGCDHRGAVADSSHRIDSYSVGFGGRVLFSVAVRDKKWDRFNLDFPSFAHGDLWLSDTARFTAARNVLVLYDDVISPLKAGPSGFVSISNITWLSENEFLALGSGLTFNKLFGPPGLMHGSVTPTGVTLTGMSAPLSATTGGLTNGGTTVVVATGGLTLGSVPLTGGSVTPFAAVPAATGRRIVDVSCQPSRCIILTQEPAQVVGGIRSTFWAVPPTGGEAQPGASFSRAFASGKISPVRPDALTFEGPDLFLLRDVVP